ncbi:glycoside hydrolase family 5 protein [Infirmifilum lucidum]|uniref:Glycoside hydrolase family 5 protein n=1 Tax=Infirmifilum lucidum TaxID=2776706 RepID=A0A7L9FJM5_9CREN|nr:glycoside hydrolase family 5 protein [Infirmifilum lucidum]QOJ79134.1 glycoside hydrolase family 5 protein [Infirmifilum lucidum]
MLHAALQVFYFTKNGELYAMNLTDCRVRVVRLYGVNWFGFETRTFVVHGLWARNWEDMLRQMKSLGFNAIRLPFCTYSVRNGTLPSSINYDLNPDLRGLTSLDIMEKIIAKANELGMYVLLDYHRLGCDEIESLWYSDEVSEDMFIQTWLEVARRLSKYPNVIGADVRNEPWGATWCTGDPATDWRLAVEKVGSRILEVAPHWLIFVEGTYKSKLEVDSRALYPYSLNWGENLRAVYECPVGLPPEKVAYSPHVYGPDVSRQPYFSDPDFPENMPAIWMQNFGYVRASLGFPIVIGEFGGRYGHGGDPRDRAWQDKFVDWLIQNRICGFFYWSWNPNSRDTGGILKDDWLNVWTDKYQNIRRLIEACSTLENLQP